MNIVLIFPPASDPAHPPLGIASLAGVLRAKGETVHLLDLNILAYQHLLSAPHLESCAAKIRKRRAELTAREKLPLEAVEEYRLIAENGLSADYLRHAVPQALIDLRNPATYADRQTYAKTSTVLRRGMEFVSAAHYPVRWYPRGFSMSYLPTRSADVLAAVSDRRQNLFIPFFETWVAHIGELQPDLVGLSINYYCQLIPAMTLAAMLRDVLAVPIVAGGGLICFFAKRWSVLAPFRDILDGYIPFEGEIPLADLVRALKTGAPISTVPGFLSYEEASLSYTPPGPPPDPAGLAPPDFEGLPFESYLAPEPVIPLLASRGCYWGRCAFCSHDQLYRGRFRRKAAGQVYREVRTLCKKFNAATVYFTDEALPPALLRALARRIRAGPKAVHWLGEVRFEAALTPEVLQELSRGGCRMLIFGLESASQRVLDLMDKGTTPQLAERILQDCRAAGIRSFVMFFVGFPGETLAEAEQTIAFVSGHGDVITHIAFTNFILEQSSPVYAEPEKYGIVEILPYGDEDLKIYADYRVGRGLSRTAAIDFVAKGKARPAIDDLTRTYLISRIHLIFLPAKEAPVREVAPGVPDLSRGDRIAPKLAEGALPAVLDFNLDEIRARLRNRDSIPAAGGMRKSPTHYLFDPVREKLIELGEHGPLLLKPCSGRYSLNEILSAVGRQNREGILDFYRDLTRAGFLSWSVLP